jgi:hypothetical protein
LAGEPGCEDPGVGDRLELANVCSEWNIGEVRAEHALRCWIDLAQEICSMPRLVETDLDAADSSE